MKSVGWTILTLVFVDELLAVVAAWIWGGHAGGAALAVAAPVAVVVVWFLFASPRARFGGGGVRPAVKALVFTLTAIGLAVAGHPGWAVAFFVFSLAVNALALLPGVRELAAEEPLAR